jgi:hypothetical protein
MGAGTSGAFFYFTRVVNGPTAREIILIENQSE